MMSDPNEIIGTVHEVGSAHDAPGWAVFSSYTFADGGSVIMQDVGPFASQEAAAICADMATAEQVEEISDGLVRRARKAYLSRVLK